MGRKFVKDADSGEIYILPDEKQALKNIPDFVKEETFEVREDIEESYNRNCSIVDLQKQLKEKDKQLKKSTRKKVYIDRGSLIACASILAIVMVLSAVIVASILGNSGPDSLPEANDLVQTVVTSDASNETYEPYVEPVESSEDTTSSETSDEQATADLFGSLDPLMGPFIRLLLFAVAIGISFLMFRVLAQLIRFS